VRGAQRGEENAARLQAYLDGLGANSRGLPKRDGKPNLSVIAAACGFDRGVFYTNEAAKLLLDEAIVALGLDDGRPTAAPSAFDEARIHEEGKVRADGRTKALEEEVIRLRAESARLRSENDRLRAIRTLMADTGRVP
jgi:hypothetical protein